MPTTSPGRRVALAACALLLGALPASRAPAEIERIDGTKLRTFAFTPTDEGSWDLVAYGREPRFVLMFCLSARSAEALAAHRADFLAMVRSYVSKDSGGE